MSFVGAAVGIGTAVVASKISGSGGGGGGSVSYSRPPETKEVTEARRLLFDLATREVPIEPGTEGQELTGIWGSALKAAKAGEPTTTRVIREPPEVPLRGVAPVEPMGEEREAARETALDLIKPQDFFALPEVQGILLEAKESGNLLANRLGRMLQASGNITSTTGRDVLGRAVTDVQKKIAASLAPFAAEDRARRERLIPELERLGLTEELREQGFTQAQLDALFEKETIESRQLQEFTIPLLQSIITMQPDIQPIVRGEGTSTFSQLTPLIGETLKAILNRPATTKPPQSAPATTLQGALSQGPLF